MFRQKCSVTAWQGAVLTYMEEKDMRDNVWMLRSVALVIVSVMLLSGCANLDPRLARSLIDIIPIPDDVKPLIHAVHRHQMSNREQLRAEYANAGIEMPTGPFVRIEKLTVAPSRVSYGDKLSVAVQYQILNAQPGAKGTLRVQRDGEEIWSAPITFALDKDGRATYETGLNTPGTLYPGEYEVLIELENGPVASSQKATFELVEL